MCVCVCVCLSLSYISLPPLSLSLTHIFIHTVIYIKNIYISPTPSPPSRPPLLSFPTTPYFPPSSEYDGSGSLSLYLSLSFSLSLSLSCMYSRSTFISCTLSKKCYSQTQRNTCLSCMSLSTEYVHFPSFHLSQREGKERVL